MPPLHRPIAITHDATNTSSDCLTTRCHHSSVQSRHITRRLTPTIMSDQSPHLTPLSTITAISNQAMQHVWDRTPHQFQREAIPRLLLMRCASHTPQALLLVQRTGGGESGGAHQCGREPVGEERVDAEPEKLVFLRRRLAELRLGEQRRKLPVVAEPARKRQRGQRWTDMGKSERKRQRGWQGHEQFE